MEHLFIVNPAAGKGRTLGLIPEIRAYCESSHITYHIEVTKYPGHASEISKKYSEDQPVRIYSVGGDGTLNEVLNGMAGSQSSLAAIPSGSGNDFIRCITGGSTPKDLIGSTVKGTERLIDYASFNNKYYINIASAGFDAEVAYQSAHFKKLPLVTGKMAYILAIFSSILACKNHQMEIKVDGRAISGKSLLVAVGNGNYYGGGMLALPDASVDDGLYDICHVDAVGRLKILFFLPKFMKGQHASIKDVHFYRGKKVEITVDKPIPMNLDGEIIMERKAVLEIFPKGLRFIIPASC